MLKFKMFLMEQARSGMDGIRAVFFDLGKVILDFSHQRIVDSLLSKARPEDRRPAELFDHLFDLKYGLCNLYDEGGISSRDFYNNLNSRFGLGVTFDGFVPLWNDIFTENTLVSEIVREVRKLRPVYLLSNVNELHWEYVTARYPVLNEMDGWVLSFRVNVKKPHPAIYRAALETAGVKEGEAVFIDDMEENTAAASVHGIHGITFTGAAGLRGRLGRLGLIR